MNFTTSTQQLREYLDTKKGKTYLISILTLLSITVMLVFAVVPAVKSITDKVAQNNVRREYLQALTEKEENLKQLLLQEQNSQTEITLLHESLPSRLNDEYVFANLGELISRTGNSLVSADFSQRTIQSTNKIDPSSKNLQAREFTIVISGKPNTFTDLFLGIESFPLPIVVDSFSISNRGNQTLVSDLGESLLSLKLIYYYYEDVAK